MQKSNMTPAAVFLFLVYLSLVLESTWCILCSSHFLHIDTIPALICWLALKSEPVPGTVSVIVAGLIAALFSSVPFYLFPISYLMAFFTIYLVRANILEMPYLQAYFFTGFVSVEILVVQLSGSGNPELLWPWEMVQALLNMVFAPPVFWVCDRCLKGLTKVIARFRHER